MDHGQIPPDRDPTIETDLILALTGLAPLLELNVIEPQAALVTVKSLARKKRKERPTCLISYA